MKAVPLVILHALLLTGCVGVVPVPSLSNRPVARSVVEPAQTDFIVVGETTRAEVVTGSGANFAIHRGFRPWPTLGSCRVAKESGGCVVRTVELKENSNGAGGAHFLWRSIPKVS